MLVLINLQSWKGEMIDVETVFLYGELNEEIYMTISSGLIGYTMEDYNEECLILNKLIYELVKVVCA
jgi:hypothetical protein